MLALVALQRLHRQALLKLMLCRYSSNLVRGSNALDASAQVVDMGVAFESS